MRPDKEKWQRVRPKNEMADNMFSNDSRLVLPKGSVLLQRCDSKRSVAFQTADSVEHEDSLWDWLTTPTRRSFCKPGYGALPASTCAPRSTTTTAATQTSAPEAMQQSTWILDGTLKTPASHSGDSGPDSRPMLAATIPHPNSCP